jgi:arginase family enzyme
VEEALRTPARLVQIGIGGAVFDRVDLDISTANGIRITRIEDPFERGPDNVWKGVLASVASQPAYVTFGVEPCRPAVSPGTGMSEAGSSNRSRRSNSRACGQLSIVGGRCGGRIAAL